MNPPNFLLPVYIREQVLKATRQFFDQKGFREVIVPTLNHGLPIEPNIHHFATEWQVRGEVQSFFLATSPESALKKMIARGIGNCFAIGKCFRNLEDSGSQHLPEFLMLEWYRENATYQTIMQDVQEYIFFVKQHIDRHQNKQPTHQLLYQSQMISLNNQWPVFSLMELFERYAHISLENVLKENRFAELIESAAKKGYATQNSTWMELYDQIFVNEIEAHLPLTPFFLVDFPALLSPLCKVNVQKPYLAERFEFYVAGKEIGNGNNENLDYKKIEQSFIAEKKRRETSGTLCAQVDQQFVQAVKSMSDSGKSFAGIGLGIDRLAMILANVQDIRQIEPLLE